MIRYCRACLLLTDVIELGKCHRCVECRQLDRPVDEVSCLRVLEMMRAGLRMGIALKQARIEREMRGEAAA